MTKEQKIIVGLVAVAAVGGGIYFLMRKPKDTIVSSSYVDYGQFPSLIEANRTAMDEEQAKEAATAAAKEQAKAAATAAAKAAALYEYGK
jgi:hypothetical protein